MFLGHIGVAFAAKKVAPQLGLGTLITAGMFVDLLWPLLLLFGIEHVQIVEGITVVTPLDFHDYPITHSLVGSIGWSVFFGVLVLAFTKSKRNALVAGGVVLSHWVLDLIVHRPDLPLFSNDGPMVGLGVWDSMLLTLGLEGLFFFGGLAVYVTVTQALNRKGGLALWFFVLFVLIIYVANVFGPPPPSVEAIAIGGNLMWLFVLWGWWIERNRTLKVTSSAQ